jgi:gluconate kinase
MHNSSDSMLDPKLDLSNAPSTLFLFGLSGGGKSYVGNLIGRLAGWHMYHADDDLTAEMQQALAERRPFTESMRDEFFVIVLEKILALQQKHSKLVITQAVYKQRHRDYLLTHVPAMEMICVTANETNIFQRIKRRDYGITIESAAALRADFEAPPTDYKIIVNDGDAADIIRQLNRYYGAADAAHIDR